MPGKRDNIGDVNYESDAIAVREHYATLFDNLFLPQGLALHSSLERYAGDYCLWVLCMDSTAFDVLKEFNLPNVELMRLEDMETAELRRVRPSRTAGEYCWTLTPFVPGFVFDRDASVERVTYLDADVCLLRSPAPVFAEFATSSKSVLITEHAYAPEYDQTAKSGRFCVQFMTFRRDGGERVRQWWADRCLEWCFARVENGKFGDQKYLDDWPTRFGNDVHVASELSHFQAPWNAIQLDASEAVMFHFQGLRLLRDKYVQIAPSFYEIPRLTIDTIYRPYLKDLVSALDMLERTGIRARPQDDTPVVWLKCRNLAMRLSHSGFRAGTTVHIQPLQT